MTQDKVTQTNEIQKADPQNCSRRKAVKTIAGGVGALAAYHVLPVNWSRPIVEQIFLPAHAAVSGITLSDPCTVELVRGDQATSIDVIRVSGFVTPPVGGLEVAIAAVANGGSGDNETAYTSTAPDGTYSVEITMRGGPGITGVGVHTGITGVRNEAYCSIGVPPANTTNPPTTTGAPTLTVAVSTAGGCGSNFSFVPNNPNPKVFTITITPNPGAQQSVTLEDIKNGVTIASFDRDTDVNGEITQPIVIQASDIGFEKGFRATYQGATGSCVVKVV